jgi:hypothetical protein
MVIRAAQKSAFENHRVDEFVSDMLAHVNRCFPARASDLGKEKVYETIRNGIDRARSYGFTASRDVCKYIDLMMVFGPGFDHDPDLPWAESILNEARRRDASAKMDHLFRTAKQYERQHGNPAS